MLYPLHFKLSCISHLMQESLCFNYLIYEKKHPTALLFTRAYYDLHDLCDAAWEL